MGKNKDSDILTTLLTKALRHKIGAIVNKDELYASKYAKDADILMKEAEKVALRQNWNKGDKHHLKKEVRRKLLTELEEKKFIEDAKFDIMDEHIKEAMKQLGLKD